MKNKTNSDTIAEGIDKSIFGLTLKTILIFFAVLGVIYLIMSVVEVAVQNHQNNECQKDSSKCVQRIMAEQSCFPLENVHCEVYIGNDTIPKMVGFGRFDGCGYVEANAFYDYQKPLAEDYIKSWKSVKDLNVKITSFECR